MPLRFQMLGAIIRGHSFTKAHLLRSVETHSARTILIGSSTGATPTRFLSLPFNGDEVAVGTAVKIDQPLKNPDESTSLLGNSIHGVVLIQNSGDGDIALWNPSIKRFKKIPLPNFEGPKPLSSSYMSRIPLPNFEGPKPLSKSYMSHPTCYAFGYDSANDDYKIVAMVGIAGIVRCIHVYSLKSNSWKIIQNTPPSRLVLFNSLEMVCLNGALHWPSSEIANKDQQLKIVTLDLASGRYGQFYQSNDEANNSPGYETSKSFPILEKLGDYLGVCVEISGAKFDVWIMKEYGVADSWTLPYSLYQGIYYFKPLVFSNNGKILLGKEDHYSKSNRLSWYDLENKSGKQVEICGLPLRFKATVCVESLCLLDGEPVVVERKHQLPSTSTMGKSSSSEWS